MSNKSFVIFATGDELVNGAGLDTNSQYISSQLYKKYIEVEFHIVCKDNELSLTKIINSFLPDHNIIVTGGLGPTDDDITRDVIANIVSRPLQYQSEVYNYMNKYLKNKGLNMYERHHRQCYFPEGATLLENPNGTAWGFISEYQGSFVYVMPGPPRENQPMLDLCIEHITQHTTSIPVHRLKWLVSAPEERIVDSIEEIVANHAIELHTRVHLNKSCEVYLSIPLASYPLAKVHSLTHDIESSWQSNEITFESCHQLIGD